MNQPVTTWSRTGGRPYDQSIYLSSMSDDRTAQIDEVALASIRRRREFEEYVDAERRLAELAFELDKSEPNRRGWLLVEQSARNRQDAI